MNILNKHELLESVVFFLKNASNWIPESAFKEISSCTVCLRHVEVFMVNLVDFLPFPLWSPASFWPKSIEPSRPEQIINFWAATRSRTKTFSTRFFLEHIIFWSFLYNTNYCLFFPLKRRSFLLFSQCSTFFACTKFLFSFIGLLKDEKKDVARIPKYSSLFWWLWEKKFQIAEGL